MTGIGRRLLVQVKKVAKKATAKAEFPANMIEKKGRTYSIGGDIRPAGDLTRFVKWPKYVRLQRSRRILYQRLQAPPAINQFKSTFDKRQAGQLFRLLNKLKPESKTQKAERLGDAAETKAAGGNAAAKKPVCVKMGINHVTKLVEEKEAKLVIIAHDVDPIEIVLWLPSLCKARGIPYCIIKSKARLGALVGKKTATCLAITEVKPEDKADLDALKQLCEAHFNSQYDKAMKTWGEATSSDRQAAKIAKVLAAQAK
jgi:large subunit ribosomal protein L7Ae